MRVPMLLIFLFGFSIIYDAEAYPNKHEPANRNNYSEEHCVLMTPETEARIGSIVDKLTEYIYNLTMEHEVFDIRLLRIVIEAHSADEVEEKDTQVQLVINDCAQTNETADAENLQEADDEDSQQQATIDNVDSNGQSEDDMNSYGTQNDNQDSNARTASGNSKIDVESLQPSSLANYEVQGPVVVRLDLDKTGNKLISGTQVKRGEHVPLLLYIQKVLGNIEYLFGN